MNAKRNQAEPFLIRERTTVRRQAAQLGIFSGNRFYIRAKIPRYANFAVDTAARVPYFMIQQRDKVRAFLIKYQDRILYATDLVVLPKDDTDKALAEWNKTYERDRKFFATVETVEYKGHSYQGLALPELVLRKIFHDNAVHWLPGIVGKP